MARVPARILAIAPRLGLLTVIVGAAMLALYWVFLVPIFQAPDEPSHLTTALNIYSAGRPISVREPLHGWNSDTAGNHVYVSYLQNATQASAFIFHYSVKEPPEYGTAGYYSELDRNAPDQKSSNLDGKQRLEYGMLTIYPCGYYSALAAWLRGVSLFTERITVLFFAARIFSVLLLIVNLSLMYLTLRESKLGAAWAVVLTAIVGFFPMTTFVSSYAQPDNLTLTMVLTCCYLALRVKRNWSTWFLVLLGLSLGGLFLTKYHYFVPVYSAVAGLVIAENLAKRPRQSWFKVALALVGPVAMSALIQIWVTGASPTAALANHCTAHPELTQAIARGKLAAAAYLIQGAGFAFSNFYLNGHTALTGSTFNSFWGDFGWTDTPLIIFTPWKTNIIRNFIAAACVVVFALTVVRIIQVLWRLCRVAWRGRAVRAFCILFSNPLLNSYFIFTVMMFGLFMVARRSFGPQGRDWFGFILAIFLSGCWYAPRAFRKHTPNALGGRKLAGYLSRALIAGLALYCVLGSVYAIRSIRDRYYNVHAVPPPYSLNAPANRAPIHSQYRRSS